MEEGARAAEPSKAEQSSLEARSGCERDKIVYEVVQEVDATTFCRIRKCLMTACRKKTRGFGALKLKSCPVKFPISQFLSPRLLPATMWFQTFFEATW